MAAFEIAEASGSGAIQLDGALVDYPIVHKARRVLALAERFAAAQSFREARMIWASSDSRS